MHAAELDQMVSQNVSIPIEPLEAFCRQWKISELSLFGSVLRDDFRAESDIDVLVNFAPGFTRTLEEWIQMQDELTRLLGRRVDLVERRAVEKSENYIRRSHILSTAERIYVAR